MTGPIKYHRFLLNFVFLMGKFLSVPYRYVRKTEKHIPGIEYEAQSQTRFLACLRFKIGVVLWGYVIRTRTYYCTTAVQTLRSSQASRRERGTSDIGDSTSETTLYRARRPSDEEGARSRAAVASCVRKESRRAVYRPLLCWLATTCRIAHIKNAQQRAYLYIQFVVVGGWLPHQKRYLVPEFGFQ